MIHFGTLWIGLPLLLCLGMVATRAWGCCAANCAVKVAVEMRCKVLTDASLAMSNVVKVVTDAALIAMCCAFASTSAARALCRAVKVTTDAALIAMCCAFASTSAARALCRAVKVATAAAVIAMFCAVTTASSVKAVELATASAARAWCCAVKVATAAVTIRSFAVKELTTTHKDRINGNNITTSSSSGDSTMGQKGCVVRAEIGLWGKMATTSEKFKSRSIASDWTIKPITFEGERCKNRSVYCLRLDEKANHIRMGG